MECEFRRYLECGILTGVSAISCCAFAMESFMPSARGVSTNFAP
jgi:hypothetical protein